MDTATAVVAKLRNRLPAGANWNDVNRALKMATRRYRSLNAEQKRRLRGEGEA